VDVVFCFVVIFKTLNQAAACLLAVVHVPVLCVALDCLVDQVFFAVENLAKVRKVQRLKVFGADVDVDAGAFVCYCALVPECSDYRLQGFDVFVLQDWCYQFASVFCFACAVAAAVHEFTLSFYAAVVHDLPGSSLTVVRPVSIVACSDESRRSFEYRSYNVGRFAPCDSRELDFYAEIQAFHDCVFHVVRSFSYSSCLLCAGFCFPVKHIINEYVYKSKPYFSMSQSFFA
jgi:hypothetical protein